MAVAMVRVKEVQQMIIDEPKRSITATLSEDVYSKLKDISKYVYRDVNLSHAMRCAIEDIWAQWNAKQNGKETKDAKEQL